MAGTQSNPTPSHRGENDFLPAAIYISEGEAFSLRWTFEICIFPPGWDSSLLCQYRSATHDYISQIFESISSQIPAATVTFTRCKPADPHRADLETFLLSNLSTQCYRVLDTRAIQSCIDSAEKQRGLGAAKTNGKRELCSLLMVKPLSLCAVGKNQRTQVGYTAVRSWLESTSLPCFHYG